MNVYKLRTDIDNNGHFSVHTPKETISSSCMHAVIVAAAFSTFLYK